MPSRFLSVIIGVFAAVGSLALVFGVLATIVGLGERESAVGSWLTLFAGLQLMIVAATMYGVALLAYVAALLAESTIMQPEVEPLPPIDPARRPHWDATTPHQDAHPATIEP